MKTLILARSDVPENDDSLPSHEFTAVMPLENHS